MRASPGRRHGRARTAEGEEHTLAPVGCRNTSQKHQFCYFFGDVREKVRRGAALSGIVVGLPKGPGRQIHIYLHVPHK